MEPNLLGRRVECYASVRNSRRQPRSAGVSLTCPPDEWEMEYRSVADLNHRIIDWIHALPPDLDAVVGIPRSGMLAANLLALHLNLPLTDVEGLIANRVMHAGGRCNGTAVGPTLRKRARVLVVDDSCRSGGTIRKVREQLRRARLPYRLHFGAVFATPAAVREGKIELYAEIVPAPRAFEWNIFHAAGMGRYCVELDGVLTQPQPASIAGGVVGGGEGLRAAEPLILPRAEIGWVVSSRSQEHREEAEKWLRRHDVRYRELVMAPAERNGAMGGDERAEFLADVFVQTGATLFLTASARIALEMARSAGRPVFGVDAREMLYPDDYPRQERIDVRPLHPMEKALRWAVRLPRRVIRRMGPSPPPSATYQG
jgi:orotate phosphoribosyltransferase